MANNSNYSSAQRAGSKEYRACLARGEYPYLPVLDDILADNPGLSMVELGNQQIPAEFVVGTKTSGRTTAFARNFMPLLPPNTEFSLKWEALCQAHLNEGIRDSVKVFEYLNRYYVQEGNKRVSVLKYFGAVSIPAVVTRVLPPKNDSTESKLYYEYLDFNKVSDVNYIWCTRLGSYKKLLQLLGKKPQEKWSTEEQRAFQRFYKGMKTLRHAKVGDTVTVVKLHGEGAVKRRIMDMGITKGVTVHIRKVAPLGDPVEVNVRGYELSLRKADADMIEIE